MTNPYRIPEDGRYRTINVSGGRSSGYMLRQILDAHDGKLPDRTAAVFCNTGKERPETLDFVRDMETHWSVPISWIEYHWRPNAAGGKADPKHTFALVNHDTASRNGEPFEQMIQVKRMLPTIIKRFCTSELKVMTVKRYCSSLGWPRNQQTRVLGIRSDEQRRVNKVLFETCMTEYPMVFAGVDRATVGEFWDRAPFDLHIDSSVGNCDLCFLRGARKTVDILRDRPDLADWWIRMEDYRHTIRKKTMPKMMQFREEHSVREMLEMAQTPALSKLGLPEPGDDDSGVDCFCGD